MTQPAPSQTDMKATIRVMISELRTIQSTAASWEAFIPVKVGCRGGNGSLAATVDNTVGTITNNITWLKEHLENSNLHADNIADCSTIVQDTFDIYHTAKNQIDPVIGQLKRQRLVRVPSRVPTTPIGATSSTYKSETQVASDSD